jgi:hypothetical protein
LSKQWVLFLAQRGDFSDCLAHPSLAIFTATAQLKFSPGRQADFATVPCGSRMNFTGAPLSKSA